MDGGGSGMRVRAIEQGALRCTFSHSTHGGHGKLFGHAIAQSE